MKPNLLPTFEVLEPRLLLTEVAFSPVQLDFPAGSHPYGIVSADLDGDGRADLATADSGDGSVSVVLNRGSGGFACRVSYPTNAHPGRMIAADLNGDGRPDLVTANSDGSGSTIGVLLNNGDGTFAAKAEYATNTGPRSLSAADFNGDGHADLAVGYGPGNVVSLLLNNGNGTFASKTDYVVGIEAYSVAAADFNGDGNPDLAVTHYSLHTVSVLLNNGDGTFAPKTDYTTNNFPSFITTADLNGDGRPDLAVASDYKKTVSLLLNTGAGAFAARTDFAVGSQPTSVTAADFNGDGNLDLAVTNLAGWSVNVLLNDGLGGFDERADFDAPDSYAAAAVDFNGDGNTDLAMAYYNSPDSATSVRVLLGNGDGTLVTGSTYSAGSIVSTADLNGDGLPDLVTKYTRSAAVLLNLGNGTFAAKTNYQMYSSVTVDMDVTVADFNGDGRPDLALTADYSTSPSLRVLLNNGDGTFGAGTYFAPGAGLYRPMAADLNGDGQPDLVARTLTGDLRVLLNDGTGVFGAPTTTPIGTSTSWFAAADLNGDGMADVVTVHSSTDTLNVLLGNGDGTFAAKTSYATSSSPGPVILADVTGDGRPDVVVSNRFSDYTLSVWLNLGNGALTPRTDYAVPSRSGVMVTNDTLWPVAADLNGDSRLDLVMGGAAMSVLLNNGDGTSFSRTDYAFISDCVAVADLDGDGALDAAALYTYGGGLSVMLNNGAGAFVPGGEFAFKGSAVTAADFNGDGLAELAISTGTQVTIALNHGHANFGSNYYIGNNPREVATADFNGDGWTDLATANNSSNILTVLLNAGDGTFSGAAVYPGENGSYNAFLAAEDFNGDGSPDVAIARERDDKVFILLNRGDGTFLPATHYHFNTWNSAVAVGDFNGDGLPDVAGLNYVSNTLGVLLNNGDGALAPLVTYVCDDAYYLEAADLNGDGMADLVLADSDYSAVSVMLSTGDGTFPSTVRYAVGAVGSLVLADVNNDRATDIVVRQSVLLNNSNGTFAPETVYNWSTTPLAAVDIDGDGNIDLIGATYYTIGVWLNLGNGVFGTRIDFTTHGTNANVNVATGDFDRDGLVDVAKDNWGANSVLVLYNRTDFSPTVVSSSVNGGDPQRARIETLSITFSEAVSVAPGSLVLHNDTTGADVDLSAAVYTYNAAARTGTWAFSDVTIADGNYTATLLGAGVRDSISNTLAGGDYRVQFFRLSCDANGDRKVDDADYAILQQHWDPLGLNPGNCAGWGDFDGDGCIGDDDETLWQLHYNPIGMAGPPARPDLVDADDSGISHEDDLTNDATPRINIVSSVPGHTIRAYSAGAYLGDATLVSGATYQYAFAPGQLTEGANAITARAFDGTLESTDSPTLTITLDTTAPAAPAVPDLPAWSDGGPFGTDNITDDVTPSFITASGVSYLRFYRDGTLTGGEYDRSPVPLPTQPWGTFAFTARTVDDAGNLSSLSSPLNVTIWPTPLTPSTPELTVDSDSGVSQSDNVTNCTSPAVWIEILDFGITHVAILWDGQIEGTAIWLEGPTWICYYGEVGPFTGTSQSESPVQGLPVMGGDTLGDGVHTVQARGYAGTVPSFLSPEYTFTVITQPSGASPSVLDLDEASDTGPSSDDNDTDDGTPTFNVSAEQPYVRIYRDGVLVSGEYETGPVTLPTQPDGTFEFTARGVDAAGNVSEPCEPLQVTIKAVPPAVMAVEVNGKSDRGVSSVVSCTNGVTTIGVTFSEPVNFSAADVVVRKVTFPGGVETLGEVLTPLSVTGTGTTTMTITLANGAAVDTWAKVMLKGDSSLTDVAGNLLDGNAPSGGSGRGYLYDAALDLPSGDGVAGGDAVFFVGSCIGDCSGDGKVNIFDAFAFNQAWGSSEGYPNYNVHADFSGDGNINIFDAFQLNSHWGDGLDDLPASLAMGAAGGIHALTASPAAEAPPLTDPDPPPAPLLPDLLAASDSGVSDTDNLTNVTTATIEIEASEAGHTMRVYRDGSYLGDATLISGTTYEYAFAEGQLKEGTNPITARSFDGVEESLNSPALTVTLDTASPLPVLPLGALEGVDPTVVKVVGSYAYAGTLEGLWVFDVSIPSAPTPVGVCEPPGGAWVHGLEADGSLIYAACGTSGVLIFDVSTPSAPTVVGQYGSVYAENLTLAGDLAFIATHAGITIVDVSTPSTPLFVGEYHTLGTALDVEVVGTVAYVADSSSVTALDVSDPTSPTLFVRLYDAFARFCAVEASGSILVAPRHYGTHVFDISTPESPVLLTSLPATVPGFTGYHDDVEIVGDLVYIAAVLGPVGIFDVSTPSSPTVVGIYEAPGGCVSLDVSGSLLYLPTAYGAGLRIVDISDPSAPTSVGLYDPPGAREGDVQMVGDLAYVAAAGLHIIDISDPSTPVVLGFYDTLGYARDVEVHGTLAYVADDFAGLQILDVTSPSSPTFVGSFDTAARAYGVTVVGSMVYLACQQEAQGDTRTLQIVDASDPSAPVLLGYYDNDWEGEGYDVEVVGSLAYLANGRLGLYIIDVSDPSAPTFRGKHNPGNYPVSIAKGVKVVGSVAYLADNRDGLRIVDVSNPGAPKFLAVYDTPGSALDVAVVGSAAYVADTASLMAFNVSVPASPVMTTTRGLLAYALATAGDLACVVGTGFHVFGLNRPALHLAAASDTGSSDSDNITADNTPTFDVPAGGPYVRVYRDGVQLGGDYEPNPVTLGAQPDGTYDYAARAVDAAGNVSDLSDPLTVTIDTTPAVVATVVVNGLADRGVSGVVSQTAGVTTIEVTFDEPVSFDAGDVVVQTVTFPGGVETIGDTLTPESVTGSGTDTMTITLADGTAVGTWVKVTLGGTASIADLAGNLLDGEPAPGGSGRGYLYDAATDLPSGDGTAGGDAVFFVGSCIGDCSGDGKVNIFDAFAFNQAWGSHTGDANYNPKADFTGDGNVNIFDAFQLNSHWGHQMDSLPSSLPMGAVGEFVTMLVTAGSVDETISAAQELVRAVTAVLPSGPLEEKPGESGAVPLQEEEGDGAGKAMTSESQEVTALVSAGELKQQAADDMLAAPATDTEEATKLAVPSSEAPLAPDDSRPPISTPGTELVNQLTLKSPTMAGETVEVSWLQDLQAASFVPTPYPQGWQRDINKTGARQLDVETADSQVAGRVVLNSLPPSGASVDVQEGVYQQGLSASFASRVAAHKHVTKRAKGLEDGSEDILVLSKLEVPLGKGKNDGRGD